MLVVVADIVDDVQSLLALREVQARGRRLPQATCNAWTHLHSCEESSLRRPSLLSGPLLQPHCSPPFPHLVYLRHHIRRLYQNILSAAPRRLGSALGLSITSGSPACMNRSAHGLNDVLYARCNFSEALVYHDWSKRMHTPATSLALTREADYSIPTLEGFCGFPSARALTRSLGSTLGCSCPPRAYSCPLKKPRAAILRRYPFLAEWDSLQFAFAFPRTTIGDRDYFHVPHVDAEFGGTAVEMSRSVLDGYNFGRQGWHLRDDMQPRLAHAELCTQWAKQRQNAREMQLLPIRERRYADIISRLETLGWAPELAAMKKHYVYDIPDYPGVMAAKMLTEKAWNKIQGPILERLNEVRSGVERQGRAAGSMPSHSVPAPKYKKTLLLFPYRVVMARSILVGIVTEYGLDPLTEHVRRNRIDQAELAPTSLEWKVDMVRYQRTSVRAGHAGGVPAALQLSRRITGVTGSSATWPGSISLNGLCLQVVLLSCVFTSLKVCQDFSFLIWLAAATLLLFCSTHHTTDAVSSRRLQLHLNGGIALDIQNHVPAKRWKSLSFIEDLLCNNCINTAILDACSPATLMKLAVSCRDAHAVIEAYIRIRFTLDRCLRPFFEDVPAFRRLQAEAAVLISGPAALQFFLCIPPSQQRRHVHKPGSLCNEYNVRCLNSDLDLYVHRDERIKVGKWLLESGYKFLSRPAQCADFLEAATSRLIDRAKAFDSSQFGIAAVFTFQKEPARIIQLITTVLPPLEVILFSHSSYELNVISYNTAWCLYPRSTLQKRQTLLLQPGGIESNALIQCTHLGFQFVASTPPNDPTFLYNHARWLGDQYTWTIKLDTAALNAVHKNLSFSLDRMSWRIVNTDGALIASSSLDLANLRLLMQKWCRRPFNPQFDTDLVVKGSVYGVRSLRRNKLIIPLYYVVLRTPAEF
ncbi:hypothetical protein NM688_g4972 [Phlebia brevispora]|uniref:Uncharacterized protein n=1 Tax=Phlebia brevispora TaxID=194682 RepID=A0ACC1T1D5_9APHY|nr:hypothetical protein NM688_g4972 [Phlebia brevispora]